MALSDRRGPPGCPRCGLPGVPILYGYPSARAMDEVSAGLLALGGCEVGPGMDDYACPRGHRWRCGDPEREVPTVDPLSAEREYRAALAARVAEQGEHGEDGEDVRALRHALAIVLAAAGRVDEARATYAPVEAGRRREMWDNLEEIRRRARRRRS